MEIKLFKTNFAYSNKSERAAIRPENKSFGIKFSGTFDCDSVEIKNKKPVNLFDYLQKEHRKPRQAEQVLERYPEAERNVGKLPEGWFDGIPKKERARFTQKINELFSKFAEETFLDKEIDKRELKSSVSELEKKLCLLLDKDIKVKYLDEGNLGRVFKIKINDEEYVVKTFFSNAQHAYENMHGRGAEVCNACFAQKNAIKGQFADFYFGKFARENDKDGFLVTKFINTKNARISSIINPYLNLLIDDTIVCKDVNENNYILDTIIEYGAVRKNDLQNKRQHKIARLIKEALNTSDKKKYERILKEYEGPDLDFVLKEIKKETSRVFKEYQVAGWRLDYYEISKPTNPIIFKMANSYEHNKIYRLLKRAMNISKKEYDAILSQFKGSVALDEVLEIYNYDLSDDDLEGVSLQIDYIQIKKLASALKDFGLYNPKDLKKI